MINITINLSLRRFADFVIFYSLLLQSLSYCNSIVHSSIPARTTVHATCGTNVELTCPIRSTKPSEVISWFRPNSTHSRLSLIAIGDILLPEYAADDRFNLISSPSSTTTSRLLINNVLIIDQGYYTCKSSTNGQHRIKLTVNTNPFILPSSPILLYPINQTFSITCSLLCDESIEINQMIWLANGHSLNDDKYKFSIETLTLNTQRLTVYLNKQNYSFNQTNYTCRYYDKESSVLVRRRTKEELHRLPRQEGSSSAHLLQAPFDSANTQYRSSNTYLLLFLFELVRQIHRAM